MTWKQLLKNRQKFEGGEATMIERLGGDLFVFHGPIAKITCRGKKIAVHTDWTVQRVGGASRSVLVPDKRRRSSIVWFSTDPEIASRLDMIQRGVYRCTIAYIGQLILRTRGHNELPSAIVTAMYQGRRNLALTK